MFLLAAWLSDRRATLPGLAGATLAAAASLVLLDDPAVAGMARAGFWMIVIAAWLAAGVWVVNLAAPRPIRSERRRTLDLLVPFLFGATVFYLWEVAVRGFGVPPVLLPPPSAETRVLSTF